MIATRVQHDTIEPGRQSIARVELLQPAERTRERLLHQIFGFDPIADHAQRAQIHATVVLLDDLTTRARVTVSGTLHEAALALVLLLDLSLD